MIICSWFPMFFGVVLRLLSLNYLTSWRILVLNSLNWSKKSSLNWWNCYMIFSSSFAVSISLKFSFGSDMHSRFLNVLTITDLFSIKNLMFEQRRLKVFRIQRTLSLSYTLLVYHIFLFIFSVCIDKIMRSVDSSSVIVRIDSKSKFASPIF